MNRTDELTERLFDGPLTDAEAFELDSLLEAEPLARVRHLALVRLELVLRGTRSEFNFAEPTVARIEADRVERTTVAVMAQLAQRPIPGPPRSLVRWRAWSALAALTAVVVIAVWLYRDSAEPQNTPFTRPADAAPEFARLTHVMGQVEIDAAGAISAARSDQRLTPYQTLHTVGDESMAVVEFSDDIRVEIYPESIVRFDPEFAGDTSQKLILIQGRISATTSGRRIVVRTGATEVEANRGSFSLWSAGLGSARVEPMNGDVRINRDGPTELVVLSPGRAAYVGNELISVQIDSRWQITTEPRDRLDFAALDVGFDSEGHVVAVSAKQWARWAPGTPDPGRTLFPPKVFNDGLAAWLTPDRRAVALCRIDDRDERIIIRDLPTGSVRGQVPVRISEPRFLCVAPDASWIATVGGTKPNNRRVHVWDVATGQVRFTTELDNSVTCLSASPDGRTLAVGVSDLGKNAGNSVVVFDSMNGQRLFELPTRRKAITTITFSPDGHSLAAGFNGAVQIWNITNRIQTATYEGFERVVTRLAFDPSGQYLAAGMGDGQVWLWSVPTGHRMQILDTGNRGVRSLAFSPNGELLVTATNKAPVAVWNVVPELPVDS